MDTADTLRDALAQTRMEGYSITLDYVARIICEVYDEAEKNYLIERLQVLPAKQTKEVTEF